jgi:hypothetical protein
VLQFGHSVVEDVDVDILFLNAVSLVREFLICLTFNLVNLVLLIFPFLVEAQLNFMLELALVLSFQKQNIVALLAGNSISLVNLSEETFNFLSLEIILTPKI